MLTAKELHEKRNKLVAEQRAINDKSIEEGRDLTAEEQERWDAIDAEIVTLKGQMDRAEHVRIVDDNTDRRTDDLDRANRQRKADGQEVVTEETRAMAMQAWCLRQCDQDVSAEQIRAAELVGTNLDAKDLNIRLIMDPRLLKRAWRDHLEGRMDTTATTGGETIPEGFVRQFELSMLAFGGMRQVSEIIRTAGGEDLPWPTANDTGNVGELLAESAAAAVQDVATASVVFQAFKYSSKIVKVSVELMQDTAFNLVAILGAMLGERIGRITNTHFTTGDASSKPNGLVTATNTGVTAASATAIISNELIDLFHSVDPAYRGPGSGWMFHDGVAKLLRKLKDGDSQYLWQPGLVLGQPDVLLGRPVTINQDMDQVPATGDDVIVFGQLNKYKIRDVANLRMRRLVERYAENDQEAFIGFSRHDGDLLDAGTDPVKKLTMN